MAKPLLKKGTFINPERTKTTQKVSTPTPRDGNPRAVTKLKVKYKQYTNPITGANVSVKKTKVTTGRGIAGLLQTKKQKVVKREVSGK
jgi:hypothetical protein